MGEEHALRVLVVGGGCAGVAAAEALSASPTLRERCQVTLIESSVRLGGKGASFRAGNNQRVLEHGLHMWPGWYANAFAMMRAIYAESGELFFDAFRPVSNITLWEGDGERLEPWEFCYPTNTGAPGDAELPSALEALASAAKALVAATLGASALEVLQSAPTPRPLLTPSWPAHATPALARLRHLAASLEATKAYAPLATLVERLLRLQSFTHALPGTTLRRARILANLFTAQASGLLSREVLSSGLDAIDAVEWSTWLRRHGASEETLASPLVAGAYGALFAFERGDITRPAISAGVMTRFGLRMMGSYRGSVLWRMMGGMGDVVFAPAFRMLQRRGVDVKLCTKLVALHGEGRVITAAELQQTSEPFTALAQDARGQWIWPEHPEGLRPCVRTIRLERGVDFDEIILALPPAALATVTHPLAEVRERAGKLSSVATASLQLWLRRDLNALGYRSRGVLHGGLPRPFDTWANMSHVLGGEAWDSPQPRTLLYACGPWPDGAPASAFNEARARLSSAMQRALPGLGSQDIRHEDIRFNMSGSERYSQSMPSELQWRPRVTDSGYDNVTLAGDWVRTGIDAGCVEAAVISGRQAARALCGAPATIFGEGR
jgi:uncharacterized protein with NAD-binding domain and iron-sulfur cluster